MRAAVWMWAAVSTAPLWAGERMTVSVCILGRLGEATVARAEAETAAVFRFADVETVWAKCEDAPLGAEAAEQHWFTLRLRGDGPVATADSGMLDTLGEAFFADENQPGYVADVYYKGAQALAYREQMEPGVLLGCVMAHEIGHLLLGPGHAPDGIMRAAWEARDLDAIRKGWLKFNGAESARIRQVLRAGR
jgi:hypothetical protein